MSAALEVKPEAVSSSSNSSDGHLASGDTESSPFTRPPFRPITHPSPSAISSKLRGRIIGDEPRWTEAFAHDVQFSVGAFFAALKDLTLHPERNSQLILRADPLPQRAPAASIDGTKARDGELGNDHWSKGPPVDEEAERLGLERVEELRIRLMPRQPKRDGKLDQRIAFYRSPIREGDRLTDHESLPEECGLVLMVPEVKMSTDVPFYHPPVSKLAFCYVALHGPWEETNGESSKSQNVQDSMPMRGRLSISYLPFPRSHGDGDSQPMPHENVHPAIQALRRAPARKRSPLAASNDAGITLPAPITNGNASSSEIRDGAESVEQDGVAYRVDRTCLALLERVYKYGYSSLTGYQKRVHHDIVVQKEPFQDLYLALKERHQHLQSRTPKPGFKILDDVKRHVWKESDLGSLPSDLSHWGSQDLAIAAFLMLLWKDMYVRPSPSDASDQSHGEPREWDSWGRPPGGFVDLGCGNALLAHILISEGYEGRGYELRARRTWPLYPPDTRAALVELPIEFPSWFPASLDEWQDGHWEGKDQCPIREGCFIIGNHADEITPWIPLLSLLPSTPVPHLSLPCCLHTLDGPFTSLSFYPPPHPHSPEGNFEDGLEDTGRYTAYLKWLGWFGLKCGWTWEKENLRIPSTKGWAIVARKRWADTPEELRECRGWAFEQVEAVRERGIFKVREKEGKDH